MTILDQILERKRVEVKRAQQSLSAREMAAQAERCREPLRGFRSALREGEPPRIIAEIKRRSPSRGEFRTDFDPVVTAKAYEESGAAAISVLTDEEGFGGHLDHLDLVRRSVSIPLLRKDFVVDAYQIDEARVAGADAVLLIVRAFAGDDVRVELGRLLGRARELGLDVLVEVRDEAEFETALACGADLVGVNNRDLRTFEVDIATSEQLASRAPQGVVMVAESGISAPEQVDRLQSAGADAFLVGEALMKQPDIGLALRNLRRKS